MQSIVPNLWFDHEAEEAAKFYTSIFSDSRILEMSEYLTETPSNKPLGSVLTVNFELAGVKFTAINGGAFFKPNPSISFFVNCDSAEEVDELWARLFEGGQALMEVNEYPFSKRYGWLQDKYGISWQLHYGDMREQKISPCLLFVGDQAGKAEEAMKHYTSVFPDSSIEAVARYTEEDYDKAGLIKHAKFTLHGMEFVALDSTLDHPFTFNEGVSLLIECDDQAEIDTFWNALSAVPESEMCGWVKDKFGVSWQVIPKQMDEMMMDEDKEKAKRVMQAMLEMKKIDLAKLEEAAKG